VPIRALLWDFGDTLVDEQWMRRAPGEFPEWPDAWNEVMDTCADDWNAGRISEREVFAAMSARSGLSIGFVAGHAEACCRSIAFHPFAWRVARERRRPQALVTVNPDLFVERVVPRHRLSSYFDTVVVSCSEGTDDKTTLCEVALDRLAYRGSRTEALLVDNRPELAEAWRRSGGGAYVYRGDEAFEADLPTLLG